MKSDPEPERPEPMMAGNTDRTPKNECLSRLPFGAIAYRYSVFSISGRMLLPANRRIPWSRWEQGRLLQSAPREVSVIQCCQVRYANWSQLNDAGWG